MNQTRTSTVLQRFAVVLAVTAASYGLPQTQAQARSAGHGSGHHAAPAKSATQQQR